MLTGGHATRYSARGGGTRGKPRAAPTFALVPNKPPTPTPPQLPLRVLFVEDEVDDVDLVVREIRRSGYEPVTRRVETAADMRAALSNEAWDVVISDYSMPTFSGPKAFALMRELSVDLPFIIVSGTVGEDAAVDAMRAGVHDFLLKGQLRRLVAAIEREMREAAMRAERRKIQEQLLISERMASVGTLAAGVAHEINNPLSIVAANLHIIRHDLEAAATGAPTPSGEDDGWTRLAAVVGSLQEVMDDAEEATERVRLIVRDLRVLSHPDAERRQAVDVHAVLESSIRMARNELRYRAKVIRQFGEVPKVDANEARLGQVFLNLLVNAAHAMPEGQTDLNSLTISTGYSDGIVTIDFADTGSGIPPEILPRIFDVFFTTKPVGVGTGLGLAICFRILTAMNGRIEVKTQVGEGTTFRVALQRARTGFTAKHPVYAGGAPSPGRVGTVLIIEDERALGRALPRLLAPHRVTVATRAREALALIDAGESFDMILCDLMMPEMTGMDFHTALSQFHPNLSPRVIFMSGGAFTQAAREFLEKVPNRRIDKPIDAPALRLLVERSLGSPGDDPTKR
jgi:signal transduction histidine kinase